MFWVEPFFNLDLIEQSSSSNLKIKIHSPKHHSCVFRPTNKWDNDPWTTYFNVIQIDPKTIHMYYRANLKTTRTSYHHEHTCVAVSTDGGYTFNEPKLDLVAFESNVKPSVPVVNKKKKKKKFTIESTQAEPEPKKDKSGNNIIWKTDAITHNFYAFKDPKSKKLFAIGGVHASSCRCCGNGFHLLESDDGLVWKQVQELDMRKLIVAQGYGTCFDTLNSIAWDELRQEYRLFLRYNHSRGNRCIQTASSDDLFRWREKCRLLKYKGYKPGHFYIPMIFNYPNSGYFLGFPASQSQDKRSGQVIDFMFSRDGYNWDVLKHQWLDKMSVQPERFVPSMLVSKDGDKNLIYINNAESTQVDLYTIRRDGLASIHTTNDNEEWFQTYPIYVDQPDFYVNYKLMDPKGYLKVIFYQSEAPEGNSAGKIGKIIKEFVLDDRDNLKYGIRIPQVRIHNYLRVKFVMKYCQLFTFSYHTVRDKVWMGYLNHNDYHDMKEKPILIPEEFKRKIKKAKEPRKILEPEVLDLSHMQKLNKKLHEKSQNVIKYRYIDLVSKSRNPDYNGDVREYTSEKEVSKITGISYSDYNERGGGCSTYGRKFAFNVTYADQSLGKVELIKNSKSNCKVEFI